MPVSVWQRRIRRAQTLMGQHGYAGKIPAFYLHVAQFQENLYGRLESALASRQASFDRELDAGEIAELLPAFESFLRLVRAKGPTPLAELTDALGGRDFLAQLLATAWVTPASDAAGFLALACLQPYAELMRSRSKAGPAQLSYALCPFCRRKPGVGVIRQLGDGGAKSLVCSFCSAEWEFRRIVCPGCGEEQERQLAVFTASEFDLMRVECCDTCKTYIKTVDLTKDGRAEPVVDEIASAPLDLWARERGYVKLQSNLMGM
jgi:formate dehydrogenase accessory protein FdhE